MKSNSDLFESIESGNKHEYHYFWKCRKLSQWGETPFEADGIHYKTAEHFMMYWKGKLFKADDELLEKILNAPHPRDTKQLGREIPNFNEKIWNKAKMSIVVSGNLAKFRSNDKLAEFLIKTGDKVLVEASPYDAIWGIHMTAADAKKVSPYGWKGENLLGYCLMEVRSILIRRADREKRLTEMGIEPVTSKKGA